MSGAGGIHATTRGQVDAWIAGILANPAVTAGAKVTAAALKARFNFTTYLVNPSVARIAADTAQRRRSIEKQIDALRAAGYLDWDGTKGRHSNRYRFLITPAHWRELEKIDLRRWAGVNPAPAAGDAGGVDRSNACPPAQQLPPISAATSAVRRDEPLRTPMNTTRRQALAPMGAPGAADAQTWGLVEKHLRDLLGNDAFDTWFSGGRAHLELGPPATITVRNESYANHIFTKYWLALNEVFPGGWSIIGAERRGVAHAA
jgi:hypothetical protein